MTFKINSNSFHDSMIIFFFWEVYREQKINNVKKHQRKNQCILIQYFNCHVNLALFCVFTELISN